MKKYVMLLAVLGLAACSHSDGRPTVKAELARVKPFAAPKTVPTTRPTSTTSTTLPPASQERDAIALAKKLGCTTTTIASKQHISGFPSPAQEVGCTIHDVDIDIEVFASHADLAKALNQVSRRVLCGMESAFGITGSIYLVAGDNFTVSAQPPDSLGSGPSNGNLALGKALGAALDLLVTTIDC